MIIHLGWCENTRKACKSLAFGSWFTSFTGVLPTSCVGYHPGKPIESVVYCLNSPSALKSYDDSVILVCNSRRQTVISGSFSLVSGKYTLTTVYLFIYLFIYYLFIHLFIHSVVFPQRSANCLSHLRCLDFKSFKFSQDPAIITRLSLWFLPGLWRGDICVWNTKRATTARHESLSPVARVSRSCSLRACPNSPSAKR